MKKITFAIAKEAPAMPPKPSTAAIKPMIKNDQIQHRWLPVVLPARIMSAQKFGSRLPGE
jgi:hypothetical protein